MDGAIAGALVEVAEEQVTPPAETTPEEEAQVVALLRQRLDDDAGRVRASQARRTRGHGRRDRRGRHGAIGPTRTSSSGSRNGGRRTWRRP